MITSKTKPKHCGKTMHRLYIRKGTDSRKWITVGYYCDECSKTMKDSDLMKTGSLDELLQEKITLVDRIKNPTAVVIDLGSSLTKAGLAGEDKPRSIFDTAVYYSEKGEPFIQNSNKIEKYVRIKSVEYIYEDDEDFQVINKDVCEIFLKLIYEKLGIKASEKALWIIEKHYKTNFSDFLKGRLDVINNSSLPEEAKEILRKEKTVDFLNSFETAISVRRSIAEVVFNRLNIPKAYFSVGELLSLYANQQTTGVVVGIGAYSTRIIPIYEGYIISHGVSIRNNAGKNVVSRLESYIVEQGTKIPKTSNERFQMKKNIRLASEELCYVSRDLIEERQNWSSSDKYNKSMSISDNSYVKLDEIRYKAPEILFENEILDILKNPGDLTDAIIESIQRCDKSLTKKLYANIMFVGGGTLYKGFGNRITKSLKDKVPEHLAFNVTIEDNRLISGWIGGSILSGMKIFEERNLWVSKAEYEEKGSSAVDRCI